MSKMYYHSPIGIMEIVFSETGISSLQFVSHTDQSLTDLTEENDHLIFEEIKHYFDVYFLNQKPVSSLHLNLSGTAFHKTIMNEIQQIPYGKHITYSELASLVKQNKSVRAVANSLGKNQTLILNPCHRIIGKYNLGGYKAGLWRKKYLLALEQGKLSSLGLNTQNVHLHENNPSWKELFEVEKEAIMSVCSVSSDQIAHIGSTCIPGFISKPIIDIILGINPDQEDIVLSQLKFIGWQYKANFDPKEWHYLAKGVGDFVTHHLHVCHYNSTFFKQHLAFRDILLNHPDILKQYEKLKTDLKKSHAQDRKAYTQAKTDFVYSILKNYGF